MRRREFVTLLSSTPAWALRVHAQPIPKRASAISGSVQRIQSIRPEMDCGKVCATSVTWKEAISFWKNVTRSQTRTDCLKLSANWCGRKWHCSCRPMFK